MNKNAQINVIDFIAGLVVIAGGALIALSYSNLGRKMPMTSEKLNIWSKTIV